MDTTVMRLDALQLACQVHRNEVASTTTVLETARKFLQFLSGETTDDSRTA